MNFKHIQQFETRDPDKLGRQLSELEDTLDQAIGKAKAASSPQPAASTFYATASRPAVALLPDAQVSVDTSSASGAAILPDLEPANFGRRFILIKPVAANSIAVSCRSSTVLYKGTTFPTISAIGVTVFYCDKYGYYS